MWLGGVRAVARVVERLVPKEPRELSHRAVPEAPFAWRRRHGDRAVPAAIVFVATSGRTWQQLPAASLGPSGATARRRFTEWPRAGAWAKLHRLVLDELGSRGEPDRSRGAARSTR